MEKQILPNGGIRADITWAEEGVWFGFRWPEWSFQHLLTKSATTKNSLVLYEVTRKRLHPLPIAISCLLRTEVRAKHGDAAKQHLYIPHFSCFSPFAHFSCPSLQAWWVYSAARCINIEHFHEHCAKHVSFTKHGATQQLKTWRVLRSNIFLVSFLNLPWCSSTTTRRIRESAFYCCLLCTSKSFPSAVRGFFGKFLQHNICSAHVQQHSLWVNLRFRLCITFTTSLFIFSSLSRSDILNRE